LHAEYIVPKSLYHIHQVEYLANETSNS